MPKNQPYPFQMPSYGNITTCKIQGLTYFIGHCFVFWFNGLLNIYYLCSLGFNLNERKIVNFVEIPLTIIGIVCCTALPMIVVLKTVNPGPLNIHCASYAPPCEDGEKCSDDGMSFTMSFTISYLSTLTLGFTTLIVCMSFITFKFYSNQRKLKKVEEKSKENPDQQVITLQSEELIETLKYSQKTARIITIQALMYILAFNCVWIFGFMEFLLAETSLDGSESFRDALALLRMVFQPSQGTFNVLIFVYHKVHALRQSDEDMPYTEALRIVLTRPDLLDESPQIISNFNLVVEDVYADSKKNIRDDVQLRIMAQKPSSAAEDVTSFQDMGVKNASVGRISFNENSSNIQPSHHGLSSLVGFSSNLESEVSHNVDVDRGHDTPSVTDSAHNSFHDDGEIDNDISYANETRFSNDDNLSFKTFFSKLSRKKGGSAVENRNSSTPKLDNFEDNSFSLDL